MPTFQYQDDLVKSRFLYFNIRVTLLNQGSYISTSGFLPCDEAVWLRAEGDLETVQLAGPGPNLLGVTGELELKEIN